MYQYKGHVWTCFDAPNCFETSLDFGPDLVRLVVLRAHEVCDQVNWEWENDRRVLFCRNGVQRLELSKNNVIGIFQEIRYVTNPEQALPANSGAGVPTRIRQ